MRMLWLFIPCCFAAACGSDRPDETGVAADTQAESGATHAVPGATGTTPGSQGDVPVTISVTTGAAAERVTGASARCQHTEQASIYGVAAAMWSVEYRGRDERPLRYLNLTAWQPRSAAAPDQFSFAVTLGSTSHRIDTVRGGETVGSGSIELHREGAGARFEITGRDEGGADVRATVQCTRFTAPSPEGG